MRKRLSPRSIDSFKDLRDLQRIMLGAMFQPLTPDDGMQTRWKDGRKMSDVIEECMLKIGFYPNPTLDDYLNTDKETRIFAQNLIKQLPLKTFTN